MSKVGFQISGDNGALIEIWTEESADIVRTDDFIPVSVSANIEHFSAQISPSIWPQDLVEFKTQIESIYANVSGEAELKTIEDQIYIKISLSTLGTGDVAGYVQGDDRRLELNFQFGTDQSYLPSLIKDMTRMIEAFHLAA